MLAALAGFLVLGGSVLMAQADPPLPKPKHWDADSLSSPGRAAGAAASQAVSATERGAIAELQERLQKAWKPPSKPARGFAAFTFDPAKTTEKVQASIYNSSTNLEYDDAAKALLLKEASGRTWSYASLPWHVRFNTDGTVKVDDNGPNPDFGPYMSSIQRSIKSHWTPPKLNTTKHVTVVFKVDSQGGVSDVRLNEKVDDEKANEEALAAVRATGKLPPLPEGSPDSVDILFHFDYNVHAKTGGTTAGGSK